jgi:hypothetical protein
VDHNHDDGVVVAADENVVLNDGDGGGRKSSMWHNPLLWVVVILSVDAISFYWRK